MLKVPLDSFTIKAWEATQYQSCIRFRIIYSEYSTRDGEENNNNVVQQT